jgi:hypothetical protein
MIGARELNDFRVSKNPLRDNAGSLVRPEIRPGIESSGRDSNHSKVTSWCAASLLFRVGDRLPSVGHRLSKWPSPRASAGAG